MKLPVQSLLAGLLHMHSFARHTVLQFAHGVCRAQAFNIERTVLVSIDVHVPSEPGVFFKGSFGIDIPFLTQILRRITASVVPCHFLELDDTLCLLLPTGDTVDLFAVDLDTEHVQIPRETSTARPTLEACAFLRHVLPLCSLSTYVNVSWSAGHLVFRTDDVDVGLSGHTSFQCTVDGVDANVTVVAAALGRTFRGLFWSCNRMQHATVNLATEGQTLRMCLGGQMDDFRLTLTACLAGV